ncbi:MAG: hypothetical protein HN353_11455 [Bdellovibrionales bacterium]|nr:hypothetical protein [Bdellovibrionales bacterium]MBT3525728.1 hypothetical protein [Bdellovibrionales bacterium]MBT7669671.1 hypothetical protein [Bdellovibrionales bacterium]MBT7766053.1 hypothetical protein [Bdellovibrionales bacterium]
MRKISSDQQLIDHFDLLTAGNFTTQQMEALNQKFQQRKITTNSQVEQRRLKINNYLKVKKIFDRCLTGDDSAKGLWHSRLLSGAKQMINSFQGSDLSSDCMLAQSGEQGKLVRDNLENGLLQINLHLLKEQLQQESQLKLIEAWTTINYRLDQQAHPGLPLDPQELCPGCSSDQLKQISKIANRKINQLKRANDHKLSEREIVSRVNNYIARLNHALKEIEDNIGVDKGVFNNLIWDSSDPNYSEEAVQSYQEYVTLYAQLASTPAGILLLTSALRDKTGPMRHLEADLEEKSDRRLNTTRYRLTPHQSVNQLEIKGAVKGIKRELQEHLLAQQKVSKSEGVREQIQFLLRNSPLSAGVVVMKNPMLAPLLCQELNQMIADQSSSQHFDRMFIVGSAVAGGALLVTGIGSFAGAWILGGTLAATAATTATVVTGAGLALGVTDGIYFTDRALEHRQKEHDFRAGFLAGSGDATSLKMSIESHQKYRDSSINAALAIPFSLMDLAALRAAHRLNHINRATRLKDRDQMAFGQLDDFIRELQKDPQRWKLLNSIKQQVGDKQYQTLLADLAILSPIQRGRIFKYLDRGPDKVASMTRQCAKR